MNCKDCGKEAKNYGRGYCKRCYHKHYMKEVYRPNKKKRAGKKIQPAIIKTQEMVELERKPEKKIWKYNPNAKGHDKNRWGGTNGR